MVATYIFFSLIFILLGGASLFFPERVGVAFNKFGRRSWKISTFGLTDMRWFYRDETAPSVFKFSGGVFLAIGAVMMILFLLSFSGPGVLSAMREGGIYLSETHGNSKGNWSISASKENKEGTRVKITYRHGDHSGVLKGEWNGERYVFSE